MSKTPKRKKTSIATAESELIAAGLRARELRKSLAVTWLASQEIIDAMRALRAGIKIPDKALMEEKVKKLEQQKK